MKNKILKLVLSSFCIFSLAGCQNNDKTNSSAPSSEACKTPYTVTYLLNDGTDAVYKTETVNYGEKSKRPKNPTREGYTFRGWCIDEECLVVFTPSTPIKSDTILYARWVQNAIPNTSEPETSLPESSDTTLPDSSDTTLPDSSESTAPETSSPAPESSEAPAPGSSDTTIPESTAPETSESTAPETSEPVDPSTPEENMITYSINKLQKWVPSDDAVIFAWVWYASNEGSWVEATLDSSNVENINVTFKVENELTGMLLARCAKGTTTPDWNQKENKPGKIYNKTNDITVKAGVTTYDYTIDWITL